VKALKYYGEVFPPATTGGKFAVAGFVLKLLK
jgi:hypothetical protein